MEVNIFWKSLTAEEYIEIDQRIMDRTCGGAKKPFTIERFCAQLAWTEPKGCPVYPYGLGNIPCKYLIEEGYEDYRCPNVRLVADIFGPIIENGSQKQKVALEFFADMLIRYGTMEKPPFKPNSQWIYDAFFIYDSLGLSKKAEKVRSIDENLFLY